MSQKLTLAAYLAQRGKKAKALRRVEAEAFGIPWPLVTGWPARHGNVEITGAMLDDLARRIVDAKQQRVKESLLGRFVERGAQNVDTGVGQQATAPAASPTGRRASVVPGFVVRLPRRNRGLSTPPWA